MQRENPIFINRRVFLFLFSLVLYLTCSFFLSYNRSIVVNYIPLDGVFQTYNPIARILSGQLPGAGFQPYLGLGPTYLTSIYTYFLGGTFAASLQANILAHAVNFILMVALVVRISPVSRTWRGLSATTLALGMMSLALTETARLESTLVNSWAQLSMPDISNLGLRSALPFLTSWLLILLWRSFPDDANAKIRLILGALVTGGQVFWSNDFGITSFFVLLLLGPAILSNTPGWKRRILFWSCTGVGIIFWGYILNDFNPTSWVDYNLQGVAKDQGWYFRAGSARWYEDFAFSQAPLTFITSLAGIYICARLWVRSAGSPNRLEYRVAVYLTLSTIAAGVLAYLGSNTNIRPFAAFRFFFPFLVLMYVYPWMKSRLAKMAITPTHKKLWLGCLYGFLVICLSSFGALSFTKVYTGWKQSKTIAKSGIFSPELGGILPREFQNLFDIRDSIIATPIDPENHIKLWSTYRTALDEMIGTLNPSGMDYIIHALGPKARAGYLDSFHAATPKFVQTPRAQYTYWEDWNWRQNWWFYRSMLRHYRPYRAGFYMMIWRYEDLPSIRDDKNVSCRVIANGANNYILLIKNDVWNGGTYINDVTITYNLSYSTRTAEIIQEIFPSISSAVIRIKDQEDQNRSNIDPGWGYIYPASRIYTIPPYEQQWNIPIMAKFPGEAKVEVSLSSPLPAELNIENCTAQPLIKASDAVLTEVSAIDNQNGEGWANGISTRTSPDLDIPADPRVRLPNGPRVQHSRAGFILPRDDRNFGAVFSGTEVEFAHSGLRRVIDVIDNQVWVDGPPLDPVKDGYPHKVKLIFR